MELGKTAHCVYKIRYHMVAVVKYRKVLINKAIENKIRETMNEIGERYEIKIDEIGFDGNHIHVLCGAKPSLSPLVVLSTIKSITARQVFRAFPKLKSDELWGGEFWSVGKYIGTVGEASGEEVIKKYIKEQGQTEKETKQRFDQLVLFKI